MSTEPPGQPASALDRAYACARRKYSALDWITLDRRARAAAVYHELCRLDTGCRRNGDAADEALPACKASYSFIARRYCPVSGRQPEFRSLRRSG
jgi:hypothetical protein